MDSNTGAALARVEDKSTIIHTTERWEGLRLVTSPAEALRRIQELQAFVQQVMIQGIHNDYAVIPGTQKKSLLQPGAQKLAEIYGLAWRFEDMDGSIQDWDRPLFVFRKRCVLMTRRDGVYVGDGIGSCNSREDRYSGRWVWDVPAGIDKGTLPTKKTKNNGVMYRVPNEDIFSLVNTIEKMACKRAFVGAVVAATRSSDIFTQDAEDLPSDAFGEVASSRSWEEPSAPKNDGAIVAQFTKALTEAKDLATLRKVGKDIRGEQAKLSDESVAALRVLYDERAVALAAKAGAPAPEPKPEATTDAAPPVEAKPEAKPEPEATTDAAPPVEAKPEAKPEPAKTSRSVRARAPAPALEAEADSPPPEDEPIREGFE